MADSFRVVLYSFLLLFCFSCSHKKPAAPPPLPISAIKIEPQTIPADFEYVGVAESSHIVELRAQVQGYLEQITYKEGGLVKVGDLMFVLDRRPFIAQLDSNVGQLATADATLWNSVQTRERTVPLYEQNALSERELDAAIAGEQEALGQVYTAQGNVDSAQIQLEFASIIAPVTGYASYATFREGALIRAGFFSDLMTTIYVLDPIWVNINVPDGDILKMRKEHENHSLVYPENNNYKIEVILSDNTVFPTEGTVDFTDPAIDQTTGTMLIRTIFANPEAWLRPGQFARVIVKGAVRPNAIVVPQTSVLQGPKGNFVYVVNGDKIESRAVTAGDWYKDYWIIQSGLKEGDVVVVDGVNRVSPGKVVQVKTWVSGPSQDKK